MAKAEAAEVTTGDLQTGGYRTHYNRAGEGNEEKVLFLHGSGPGATGWSNWQFALPALGQSFDCIGPDMIGYGQSEHPEHPPHGTDEWLEVWMDQIGSILDQLGLEKVHIVGNSMGGALALHFLKRNPEKVGRLVLMGTSYGAFTTGRWDAALKDTDLRSLPVSVERAGETVGAGKGSAAMGDPALCVAWLANKLHAFGISLAPGDVVLSGALAAAVPVSAGDQSTLRHGEQEPLAVRFT